MNLAAEACRSASVPVSLHLDHAQDEDVVRRAATMPFDSIMVDMSHYELEENLQKTTELVRHCHERGIAVEAEPGRIEGGEDGVQDTSLQGLQGLLTDDDQARRFMDTGIDFLAPAFGNVHGRYGGVENIKLDYERFVATPCQRWLKDPGFTVSKKSAVDERFSSCMAPTSSPLTS